ncbi:MAG: cation diffusion facilitator family transporter [Akkermansiaceae bacterium]
MSRDHHHHHAGKNLGIAFFLNLVFTVIEVIGGVLTNSIAILSDALHDFGDTLSLGLAWYFEKISNKQPTEQHTYGYKRFRLLGGLITGLVLVAGLSVVLWNAVQRLAAPEIVHAEGTMALAALGIIVNGLAVLQVRSGSSLTEKVVSWHLLEDVLGWVAVLVGAAAMAIWDLPVIDSILSIGISLFVLWNVARNLKQVIMVFLQTVPEGFDVKDFENRVNALPGVSSIHHLHLWSLDGEDHVLTLHVVLSPNTERDREVAIKGEIHNLLGEHEFTHVTIATEWEGEPCPAKNPWGLKQVCTQVDPNNPDKSHRPGF